MKVISKSNEEDTGYPSTDAETSSRVIYVDREEKNYRRLLDEQREYQKKKSNIENRLSEIENELNKRREEIRSGNR